MSADSHCFHTIQYLRNIFHIFNLSNFFLILEIVNISFLFVRLIFLCNIIDQFRHGHTIFDGLIQDETNLRRIPQIHIMSKLTSDIAFCAF